MASQLYEGFVVRPPTLEDAKKVVELFQYTEEGSSHVTEEDTILLWTSPEVDLTEDISLIFTPQDQLVAYLQLGHREPSHMNIIVKVHPDYIYSALQSTLLTRGEERAFQLLSQVRADARVSVHIWCRGSDSEYRVLLKQAGFTHVRSNLCMEIEMDGPPSAPIWPDGIELQPFTPSMARSVHAAEEEGFKDHWGYTPTSFETFEHVLMTLPQFDPALWFLAFADGKIVGLALCESRRSVGWIDSLTVLRSWRRKGLALALLHHAFGEFYRRGERKVALYVDAQSLTGATRLYERAGMYIASQYDRYEKELRTGKELGTQALED